MICGTVHSFPSNARVRVAVSFAIAWQGQTLITPRHPHGDHTN
jgi:hypothetical protein